MNQDIPVAIPQAPANTRSVHISRKEVFLASLRFAGPKLLLFYVCLTLLSMLLMIGDFGLYVVLDSELWTEFMVNALLPTLVAALALVTMIYHRVLLIKDVPGETAFGFDHQGLFSQSAYSTEYAHWEYFLAWKNRGDHYLLRDPGRWVLVPKRAFSSEENALLEKLLREKANRASRRCQK